MLLNAMLKKESNNLSKIMSKHRNFQLAVDFFVDTLRKKRDWKKLESEVLKYKELNWNKDNIKKIFQWERQAHSIYVESQDFSLNFIKSVASALSDNDSKKIENWIKNDSSSKEAWDISKITIDDSINIIKARVVHLIYMSWSPNPINIGNLIDSKE